MENQKSAVEIFFNAVAARANSEKKFEELSTAEVIQLIQAINSILRLL